MALQFLNTTTNLGIIQLYERYTGLGLLGVSGVPTVLDEAVGFSNFANREAWHTIFMSYGGWQYDDSNQTDLPSATTALVASQVSYGLPTGQLTVRGIEILNQGNVWNRLIAATEEQIRDVQAVSEWQKTPSQPRYYRLVGETIFLYPPANYSQAASMRVYFDRGSVDFADTDTTRTPGFAGEYHDYIPLRAAIWYLTSYQSSNPKLQFLKQELEVIKKNMKDFYSSRYQQMFPPKITVSDPMYDAT